jgi:hypothetical protein
MAMSHEVHAEATERLVRKMTDDDRDPYEDAALVLRGSGSSARASSGLSV